MNRMEEFEMLQSSLEQIPQWDPVENARKRSRKEHRVWRPLVTVAAVLCLFVTLINVSPTASAMCREIPFLKEVVEMLTFNPSLRIAIEHDYVQMVGEEQSKDGVTARVEYLIVDQKQVNVFFTLKSDQCAYLDASPDVFGADGEPLQVGMTYGGIPEEDESIRQLTIDFMEENVPDYLKLTLRIRDFESQYAEEEAPPTPIGENWPDHETPEILTELTFDLHFDPQYTAQGRSVEVNQTVELDGQKITVTDMEIYPTHIRINVTEDESNTSWLTSLRFYLELEDGRHVETISNGISATGSPDTPSMVSYRAESSYFFEADCIRLCITSADFLDKDRENITIDFETLKSDPLPQGVKLWSAERKQSGTELTFLEEPSELSHVQILSSTYYDLEGNEYYCGSWSSGTSYYDEASQQSHPGWDYETYYLEDFHASKAVFKVHFTHFWVAEAPVVVELERQD